MKRCRPTKLHKSRNSPNSSTSAQGAGMKWHHRSNCYISFCRGHNCSFFLCVMFAGVRVCRWGGECLQQRGQIVFGHLSPMWVINLALRGGSMLNKPPVESVFVLEGSANKDLDCSRCLLLAGPPQTFRRVLCCATTQAMNRFYMI